MNKHKPLVNVIANMDTRGYVATLEDDSVQCVVTSPPYFALRDYGEDGQIGLEPTPEDYVAELSKVFSEVHRALKPDGVLWLNLGDSYVSNKTGSMGDKSTMTGGLSTQAEGGKRPDKTGFGIPPKNQLLIPHRVALSLQQNGWIVRSTIIWHKPATMPESVKDRPTNDFEYVFLLTKSPTYYYDGDAMREPAGDWGSRGRSNGKYTSERNASGQSPHRGLHGTSNDVPIKQPLTRNKRTVWSVSPKPFKDAHFATFPPDLIEPMILAGSKRGDTVLDPFMGSGTTAIVARSLGRNFMGCELNSDYVEIAERRLAKPFTAKMF